MMHVKLLRYTPEPDRTVAMSARLCYSPIGAAELETKMSDKEVASLVRRLGQMGHTSTFEHVSFTFAIEGVSRVLTHQLVRHRIASYSQQSQRYVKEHDFETILPPSLAARPECKKEFQDLCGKIQDLYNKWTEAGVPAEDARYILPNGNQDRGHHERPEPAPFLSAPVLQPGSVGNPCPGLGDAPPGEGSGAHPL